jgi:hypothetical protein
MQGWYVKVSKMSFVSTLLTSFQWLSFAIDLNLKRTLLSIFALNFMFVLHELRQRSEYEYLELYEQITQLRGGVQRGSRSLFARGGMLYTCAKFHAFIVKCTIVL